MMLKAVYIYINRYIVVTNITKVGTGSLVANIPSVVIAEKHKRDI